MADKNGYVIPEYKVQVTIDKVAADANELYSLLTADRGFCEMDLCPPEIDLNSELWDVPYNEDLYENIRSVTMEEFTNQQETGDFDQLVNKIKMLLANEHEHGRITSTEYARTFTALIETTLTNATQFILQKDIAFWQAQKGRYDAWTARAQVELLKNQIALSRLQIANQQMEYAQGKMGIVNAKSQYDISIGQRDVTLPKQAESQDKQMDLYDQQITSYQRDAEFKMVSKLQDSHIAMLGIFDDSQMQVSAAAKAASINPMIKDAIAKLNLGELKDVKSSGSKPEMEEIAD